MITLNHLDSLLLGVGILAITLLGAQVAQAHCDTMDGPVIADAQHALEYGDVTPVLKWVKAEAEPEIREAFDRTLSVRNKGPEAMALADTYFFETLVRVHRAGEGAPYDGIKPAGAEVEPGIKAADAALESGAVDALVREVTDKIAEQIRERFELAASAQKHKDDSAEAGREFVEAYVVFMHFVERIYEDAANPPQHGSDTAKLEKQPKTEAEHKHEHK